MFIYEVQVTVSGILSEIFTHLFKVVLSLDNGALYVGVVSSTKIYSLSFQVLLDI